MNDDAAHRQRQLNRAARWVLERTVDDLRDRAKSSDEYILLGIAGVLRRTLIDQHPVAEVGRAAGNRTKLEFRFRPYDVLPERDQRPDAPVWLRFPDPGRFREPQVSGSLKVFRAAPIASVGGTAVSVSALIKYFANVEGGVHVGHPNKDSPAEAHMQMIFAFRSAGWKHGLALLSDVAAVTADALDALE